MLKLISGQFTIPSPNNTTIVETLTNSASSSRIMFALELHNESKHVVEKMKHIFETQFFNDETEVLLRFENCMKEINALLKEANIEIDGTIAAYDHSELHVSQAGEGEAYLIRRGKLNVIIENIQSKEDTEDSSDIFTSIASGDLMIDDKVILTSLRVLRYATASQIVNVLADGISEGIDAVKDLLQVEAGQGALLCLHTRGESVFAHSEKTHNMPRRLRASLFTDLASKFENFIQKLSQKTGKEPELVQSSVFAGAGVILAIILIWAVSAASIDTTAKETTEAYRIQMLKIEKELQTAETRALMSDMASANAILDKVESTVQEVLNAGVFTDEALVILERVQTQRDDANKITRIKNISERVLTDFTTTDPTGIQGFEVMNDDVYAYTGTSLYKTVLDHIDPAVTVSEADPIIDATALEDQNTIIFTTASGAIQEFTDNTVSGVNTADETGFKNAVAKIAYSRFMYFLVPQENQIYKYEKKREGFTAASTWLNDETISLEGALDIAIDGSVYVLKKDGGVALFHKGSEIALNVEGDEAGALEKATKIFVKTDMRNIYFLNPERNSVVVFSIVNNGLKYLHEYIFETEGTLNDFHVNQDEQKLIVSDESKIYEITL